MAKFIAPHQAAAFNYCGTLLYYFMAREMTEQLGVEGERAVRQGLREYAAERGRRLRAKHLSYGMKTNV